MKQEAVAYAWCKNGKMLSAMIGKYEPIKTDPYWLENGFDAIPLYTAPRELSDEEIKAIDNSVKYSELALSHDEYMNNFARAILKKASEK
jgi:hypothetical protein